VPELVVVHLVLIDEPSNSSSHCDQLAGSARGLVNNQGEVKGPGAIFPVPIKADVPEAVAVAWAEAVIVIVPAEVLKLLIVVLTGRFALSMYIPFARRGKMFPLESVIVTDVLLIVVLIEVFRAFPAVIVAGAMFPPGVPPVTDKSAILGDVTAPLAMFAV
jgi:hypothetical protein